MPIEPDQPIEPDDKDWTWVLQRRCPECGFDASGFPTDQVAARLRGNAQAWATLLARPGGQLRNRSRPDRWSPLEYACHVRDVFVLYDERLRLMLTTDDPTYPNWDQDQSAADGRYQDQDPALVASQLTAAVEVLAARFDTVDGDAWDRRSFRSDGAHFTVDSFSRYLVHDPVHHLFDVTGDPGD
jgi:hypothetical protein